MNKTIGPRGAIRGRLSLPGDKSISHRALLLAAMRNGVSHITSIASGQDVASTAACIATLGARPTFEDGYVRVAGNGWQPRPDQTLDCGNSGSTMRMMTGALAGRAGEWTLRGDGSLSSRPMGRVAEPLKQMGATIEVTPEGTAPIHVVGASLKGIDLRMQVASAQVKSAVVLAGLMAEGQTVVREDVPTRDHTERMLAWLGAGVERGEGCLVKPDETFFAGEGFQLAVPGDISSAAFLIAAALLREGSDLVIDSVGLNPTRIGVLKVMRAMGGQIEIDVHGDEPEPMGSVHASGSQLQSTVVSGEMIPACIDELPLIALLATQAEGRTVIADASELRVKESDRIAATVESLRLLGAKIEETHDGMVIDGPTSLQGGVVDPRGDHRIALMLAVGGVIAEEPVTIADWGCTAVSYPTFEADLDAVST